MGSKTFIVESASLGNLFLVFDRLDLLKRVLQLNQVYSVRFTQKRTFELGVFELLLRVEQVRGTDALVLLVEVFYQRLVRRVVGLGYLYREVQHYLAIHFYWGKLDAN